MNLKTLPQKIVLGEDFTRQFKADVKNPDSLALEKVDFASTNGDTSFIGVADDGTTPGLSRQDVARINQHISNAASQRVRCLLTVQTANLTRANGLIELPLPEKPASSKQNCRLTARGKQMLRKGKK
ncbi:MAG: hypothetical protein GXY80_02760 [Syntrophorhabdus aromaticivorans]|uniref:Uncharacterized protein n=1 Tax=Syntrophorhabdus aromaticivorans TaxID=328301 RepID=A0A971M3E8_9BACT|nr:hypothetical protein [Syntrophorhabdus aromaticivorans]